MIFDERFRAKSIFLLFSFGCQGVHLNSSADQLGQQYVTPKEAIEKRGADILIVGRAILESNDRVKAVEEYRAESYRFYETFRQN